MRGDQIEVFKILKDYENIEKKYVFLVKQDKGTSGHEVTLAEEQCRLDIRKFTFSHKNVNECNRLSAEWMPVVLTCLTIKSTYTSKGHGTLNLPPI